MESKKEAKPRLVSSGPFDNEKANGLIKDTYRQGYEIPDRV